MGPEGSTSPGGRFAGGGGRGAPDMMADASAEGRRAVGTEMETGTGTAAVAMALPGRELPPTARGEGC